MEILAAAFAIYIFICGFVWAVFVRLEPLLKDDTREKIATWVSGSKHGDADNRWPATFGVVFDRVFTEKHLSWGCFWRSCVASLLAVVLMTAILFVVNSSVRNLPWGDPKAILGIGVIAGMLNLLPDYLSLLETRFVLRRMAKGGAGAFKLLGWLIFDAVVTLGIFTTALLLLLGLTVSEDPVEVVVYTIVPSLLSIFGVQNVFALWGIFLYSTFFISVWVWLYAFSGIAVRLVYRAKGIQTFVDKHLDVTTRPLSVMGVVLIVVFTIVYWPAIAIVGGN
jgi:hypothetical protein